MTNILWVDDEIEHLRAHILFLEKKGYTVATASNGSDAIDMCQQSTYDIVLLDEQMPGLSGLETLARIKDLQPQTPVCMVTKNEEEDIMDQAIGAKIADYLIKPVNPAQILLALKKHVHGRDIITEHTEQGYREQFADIQDQIDRSRTFADWVDTYRRLVHWELLLDDTAPAMADMLHTQKDDANRAFAKFVKANYVDWFRPAAERPLMSHRLLPERIFPALDDGQRTTLIVIDNFRYDQWRAIAPEIADIFHCEEELYLTILPTATQYCRNAIFSALLPQQIASMFPELWVDEDSEEGKNLNEAPLIHTAIERYRRHDTFTYHKLYDSAGVERLLRDTRRLREADLNVVVVNFVDMLSHARTESKMVRELVGNEAAYRSITLSWFRHSGLRDLLETLARAGRRVVITTDHGTIRVDKALKVVGERNTNTNLRYKLGRNLNYNPRDVFAITHPEAVALPAPNVSTTYVFATGSDFLAYPNNYNHYAAFYRDTFQHGGISMEEMLVPLITLKLKN